MSICLTGLSQHQSAPVAEHVEGHAVTRLYCAMHVCSRGSCFATRTLQVQMLTRKLQLVQVPRAAAPVGGVQEPGSPGRGLAHGPAHSSATGAPGAHLACLSWLTIWGLCASLCKQDRSELGLEPQCSQTSMQLTLGLQAGMHGRQQLESAGLHAGTTAWQLSKLALPAGVCGHHAAGAGAHLCQRPGGVAAAAGAECQAAGPSHAHGSHLHRAGASPGQGL